MCVIFILFVIMFILEIIEIAYQCFPHDEWLYSKTIHLTEIKCNTLTRDGNQKVYVKSFSKKAVFDFNENKYILKYIKQKQFKE